MVSADAFTRTLWRMLLHGDRHPDLVAPALCRCGETNASIKAVAAGTDHKAPPGAGEDTREVKIQGLCCTSLINHKVG